MIYLGIWLISEAAFFVSSFILDVKGSSLTEGSLNALPDLSLFTLVLIWVFLDC